MAEPTPPPVPQRIEDLTIEQELQDSYLLTKKHLRDRSSVIEVAFLRIARVVKWQTRTFEGRMPKGLRVQVPPRARFSATAAAGRTQLKLFVSFLLR